ncbi:sialic acid-binding Ig-like lectin 10 isoform X3 [Rhinolophus sinicus]|uniref:sialic acid-binding Ig-like lectin 10 isoform X3 n=1 Tax=Rhinolophus sinicus TaxID=89399 RepID=UPI003D796109
MTRGLAGQPPPSTHPQPGTRARHISSTPSPRGDSGRTRSASPTPGRAPKKRLSPKMVLMLLFAVLRGGSSVPNPEFLLNVQRTVTVQEGLCVLVPCNLSYPSKNWTEDTPAYGYWFQRHVKLTTDPPVATNNQSQKVQKKTQGRFQLVGSPQDKSCSLLIRDAQKEDTAEYFFRVERGSYVRYNFMNYMFFLKVTALTRKPDVYIPEMLEPGRQVTVICVFDSDFEQCPAPTFSWMGAALSSQETRPTGSHVSMLTLTPRPQDHGTNLTCRVDFSNKGMSTENTVRLNVAWSRGLELELPRVKPADAGHYTCRAENRLGFQNRTLNLSVQYAPENLRVTVSQANGTVLENLRNGTSLPVLEGQSLRLLCVTHSNPPALLSWARGGQTLHPSQPSDPGVLELPQIQMEHEGEFICHAQNLLGSQYVSLSLSVHYPPQLLGPSCSWEEEGLHCSCSSRAQPAPSVRWQLGERLLEGNLSNASFKVSFSSEGPWANSSLSLSEGLSSSLRLSCKAENVHGTQSVTVLQLPDKKGLISEGFSNGIALGTGVTTLLFFLCLCLMRVLVKTLRKKQTQAETLTQAETATQAETRRPRITRRSTILDYVNVVPNIGALARNRKAQPSNPSRTPPADADSPQSKNSQELRCVSHSGPGPKAPQQAPKSGDNEEELHYAALNFPGRRPRETQESEDTGSEYAEIRFH